MKKNRILAAGCALCMSVLLCGCRIGNREIVVMLSGTLNDKQVFKMDKTACGLKEARVYLTNYQNIYGTAYGIDLWEHDFGENSLEKYVKDVTLEKLTYVVGMDLLAESRGMELTDREWKLAGEAAEEYYDSLSDEETAYLGVTESDIQEYYAHYALAQKLYASLTESVNGEVSDDEARVMELMQIFVMDEKKASEVEAKLRNGDDFASLANNYNQHSAIQITVARDELPGEVEQAAFGLDNGEISGKIKTDNGYYFVKCLNKYNEELTEANKSNIVEKREKEAFDDIYKTYVSGLSAELNRELWEGLEMDTGGTISTDSFFEVYEAHFTD